MNGLDRGILLVLTLPERRLLAAFCSGDTCASSIELPRVLPIHRTVERLGFVRIDMRRGRGGSRSATMRLQAIGEPVARACAESLAAAHGRLQAAPEAG
jgi:hypothetical protein